ncbi:MAG TPA: glycosyltransferase family 4 protein [Candidatus Saccharimonadales bacterium]|nr:glycosyltransferase family 4 protein [Candidatus Saccharimonadales bacterium]
MKNTPKLKIGFVFDDTLDSSDGVAQYVKTIGAWLSGQGHEVRYLVGETKLESWQGGKIYSLSKNYKVRFNGNRLTIPGPASRRQIKKILHEEKFDVLHVQVPYSPLLASRVIRLAPKNTVILGTFHIFPAGWLSQFGSRLLRIALANSKHRFDAMVSVSRASAEFARVAYGFKTEILPNAVDISKFRSHGAVSKSDIVFLGRLVGRKGCLELLKAVNILVKEPGMSKIKVRVAGAGGLESMLKNYVKENKLGSNVEFFGFVSEEEKAKLLAGARLACFPALYGEAFGIVLIEAMAAGSGVVLGGDNPGYRSVLGEREELLVDPRDSEIFSQRLMSLLTNSKLAADLHTWQEQAVKQYDVNVVGRQIESIYHSLIANKNKNEHN